MTPHRLNLNRDPSQNMPFERLKPINQPTPKINREKNVSSSLSGIKASASHETPSSACCDGNFSTEICDSLALCSARRHSRASSSQLVSRNRATPMQHKPELLAFVVRHVTSSASKLARPVHNVKVCNLIIESLRSAPIKARHLICKMQITKL